MKSVLIPLAQGCEELEAVTVIDLLRRAGIEVVSAGLDAHPVRASRGTVLIPDTNLNEALKRGYDMLVLPGGQPGTNSLKADHRILELARRMATDDHFLAAICAAPSVLAEAGLLDGRIATAFPGALDVYPKVKQQQAAVVEDGKIITSRGPGTEKLAGRAKRDEVESGLQR
jgi:protein deglycase